MILISQEYGVVHFVDVPIIRALLFGVYGGAPDL